ncbi:hypothetical protein Vafri_630, partial [Volvox africanus]
MSIGWAPPASLPLPLRLAPELPPAVCSCFTPGSCFTVSEVSHLTDTSAISVSPSPSAFSPASPAAVSALAPFAAWRLPRRSSLRRFAKATTDVSAHVAGCTRTNS